MEEEASATVARVREKGCCRARSKERMAGEVCGVALGR